MRERSEADPIRVVLADNHTMFREGIGSVLAGYVCVIPELKLTDKGLVDVARFELVSPFV